MARRVPRRLGPASEPPKPKPFTLLPRPRIVTGGLPSDLTTWYQRHEGIGSDGPTIHHVRLCKLAEVQPVAAVDLGLADDSTWTSFRGLLIAQAAVDAKIIYTLAGPAYRFGTVFAQTPTERITLERNLVGWILRLERDDWIEWGLNREAWTGLPRGKSESLRRHFDGLNRPSTASTPSDPDA